MLLGPRVKSGSLLASTTAIAAMALAPQQVTQAQEAASSDQLTEVVVTARARTEQAANVPISIQTFSAAQLFADQITDLTSLQYQAGFTFNNQGMSTQGGGREFPVLTFRGLATGLPYGDGDSGALFVDGIFVSGGTASVTMADVSRVEVLKGPQNVYFGKNTFGGAINLITANPSEDFHGYANVGYSTKESFDDTFSVEGALVPNLLTARVTGEFFHQGKQYTSFDGGPLGEEDTKGVTAVLYFTPTSNAWIRTRLHYSHDDDSAAATGYLSGAALGTTCPGLVNKYFCNGIPSLADTGRSVLDYTSIPAAFSTAIASNGFDFGGHDPLLSKVPTKDSSGLIRDTLQGSLASGVTLPNEATIGLTAGWNQSLSSDIADGDHTQTPLFLTDQPIINHDFQADLRYVSSSDQPLRYVGGVSFFQSLYRTLYDSYFAGGVYADGGVVNEIDETKAVYGSLEYDIISVLTATAEVRYQKDTLSDKPYQGLGSPEEVAEDFDHVLPRLSVRYHPTKDTNVYASYSEGIEPPFIQASYANGNSYTRAALAALSPDAGDYTKDPTLRVWEFGLKQAAFDNRVNFNIDYYTQIWNNAVVSNYVFNPPGNHCPDSTVGTSALCPYPGSGAGYYGVSRDHIQGIEFDGSALITPKWTVHAAFNYTYAIREAYSDQSYAPAFTSGVEPIGNGKRVDLIPDYQGAVDSTFRDQLVGDWKWYVHGLVTFTGSTYAEPTDIAKTNAYARVNAAIGVQRGPITVELYGTNLFNDKNWDMAVRYPDANFFFNEAYQGVEVTAPNPVNVGIRVSGKF